MRLIPSRLREERGTTLIELMIAAALSTVVLALSLTAFESLQTNSRSVALQNDQQDVARRSTDRMARELRNLASPSQLASDLTAQPMAVDKATDYDFVFRVVDDVRPAGSLNTANVKRVRYCLDRTNPSNAKLWSQTQTWTSAVAPAVPATAACPAPSANNETSWRTGMDRQAAANVVNTINGQARPAFNYDSTDMTRITRVRTDLFVDTTPNARPVETRLRSGVYLRNQNRQPTASFTATVTADKRLILNGSASEDPEGMPLSYQWYIDPPATLPDCKVLPVAASCAGTGVVFEKTGLSGGGSHTIKLVVSDPALLAGTTSRTVTYPS